MPRLSADRHAVREAMARREPFVHDALSATEGGVWYTGQLPEPWREQYLTAYREDRVTYTVWSYSTPIGWVLSDGEVVTPNIKYGPTITTHQAMLYALRYPSDGYAEAAREERPGVRERRIRGCEDD